ERLLVIVKKKLKSVERLLVIVKKKLESVERLLVIEEIMLTTGTINVIKASNGRYGRRERRGRRALDKYLKYSIID
ncbi:MAG: hypothetical protein ACI9NY_000831, partial [Kiritimatiellia bacterium]